MPASILVLAGISDPDGPRCQNHSDLWDARPMPTRKTRPLAWLKRYLPKPMLLLMECSPDVPLHARTATGRANWCGWPPSQAVVPAPQVLFATAILCLASSWYFAAVIAPAGLGLSAPSVQQGLFPEWFGCREILHRRDPSTPRSHATDRTGCLRTSADGVRCAAEPASLRLSRLLCICLLPDRACALRSRAICRVFCRCLPHGHLHAFVAAGAAVQQSR